MRHKPNNALSSGANGFDVLVTSEDSKCGVPDLHCVELVGHHSTRFPQCLPTNTIKI